MEGDKQWHKRNNHEGSSNSSSGGSLLNNVKSSSRKQKHKKVPQRGLGVAQLEKIRLEEQHKSDAPPKFPYLLLPLNPDYNQNSSSNSTFGAASSSNPFSKDPIFRLPKSVQDRVLCTSDTSSLTNHIGWLSPVPAQSSVCDSVSANLWSSSNSKVDPRSGLRSNMILPLPGLNFQYQQPPQSSSSVVSFSSAASSLPSSLMNFLMVEPPSNQSYSSNFTSVSPKEDETVGFKKPYPVSLDNHPGPCLPYKIPTVLHHPMDRPEEPAASRFYGGMPEILREGRSFPTPVSEINPNKSNKVTKKVLIGDFLTLAPPNAAATTGSLCKSSTFKHPADVNLRQYDHRKVDFDSLPYQMGRKDSTFRSEAAGEWNHQLPELPYYSFFPTELEQNEQATSSSFSGHSGSVGESLDLDLRL